MAITNIPMTTTVAGLAVVSYDTNKLNTSTFDNVSFQPAPMFTNLSMSADRSSFTLKGAGATNQPYVLQATASLVLPVVWAPLATNNSGSDGAFSFVDLQATNYNQRYYRVATP